MVKTEVQAVTDRLQATEEDNTELSKQFTCDGLYHISTSSQAPFKVPRDVILCCQNFTNKKRLLHALQGKTPLLFENNTFKVFQDLSIASLWQKFMRPTLRPCRRLDAYRWTYPKDGATHKALGQWEGLNILQALGLSKTQRSPPTNHVWNVSWIALIVPGRAGDFVTSMLDHLTNPVGSFI
ncbi:Hypothetical predicted protein [Pelobates cultripes]|uniref:Uncharacterized protein n=1 Tax=Pelobates cultripes TaxID=61616 RepID=A0AAD1RXQ8_PELCU|nr:Hypothetical predicted protein [Pelobates cultripes]